MEKLDGQSAPVAGWHAIWRSCDWFFLCVPDGYGYRSSAVRPTHMLMMRLVSGPCPRALKSERSVTCSSTTAVIHVLNGIERLS